MSQVDLDGVIHEDVMDEIFNIDPIDLPYQDMCGRSDSDNPYRSWVKESLDDIATDNARVEGADAGAAAGITQARVGNHHQISDKVVSVSNRSRRVNAIGYADRLVHELMVKQKSLRRDMEAILLTNQASVEMVTTTSSEVAGLTAGAAAMFETNIQNGTAGGFSGGIYSAPTPGAAAALTEATLRDAADAAYTSGGDPTVLMSTPGMLRKISEYLFTSSARIATMQTNVRSTDGEYGKQGVTAIGAVNTFISDYNTLTMVPNRMQQVYDNGGTDCVDIFLFDPDYWEIGYLQGIETEELAKTGTADNRQMSVDYCNIALQEKSSAIIMGINPALALTAP